MLAVGADLDERNAYSQYLLAGGNPKKFKWSSPDKAGTAPRLGLSEFIQQAISGNNSTVIPNYERVKRIADSQGREIVFVDQNGQAWTVDGKKTERTLDHFPLPITYKEYQDS